MGPFSVRDYRENVGVDIKKYDFVDTLRGYAILGVILVHSAEWISPHSSVLKLIMSSGATGVQLFYIASAMTLCMSLDVRSAREGSPLRNFFIRRFFRIAPLFYLAIIAYTWLYGFSERYWAPNGVKWWFIPLTALFLHGTHPETVTSVVPGGWSIAVEMAFYVMLPFLFRRLRTVGSLVLFCVLALVANRLAALVVPVLLSGYYPSSQQYLVSNFTYLSLLGQLPVFAIGMLTFRFWKHLRGRRDLLLSCGLLACAMLLFFALLSVETFMSIIPQHVLYGVAFAVLSLALALYRLPIVINPIIVWLGRLSFSMYLSHFAVITMLEKSEVARFLPQGDLSSGLAFGIVVLLTACLSFVTYHCIERPGISLGRGAIGLLESDRRGFSARRFLVRDAALQRPVE